VKEKGEKGGKEREIERYREKVTEREWETDRDKES